VQVLAILQARVSSTRLAGKVLRPILDKPMLLLQIERILRSKMIDKIVVATSHEPSDDPLAEGLEKMDISYFRGSLNDVLDRFYQAAQVYKPKHIVRLTGDCPLIDPELIDQLINLHINEENDFSSNTMPPTFPDGLDVEVMRYKVLETMWLKAHSPSEREHVTLYVRNHQELFKIGQIRREKNLEHLRWTVDEPEDFQLVSSIYNALYLDNPAFSTQDILNFLEVNNELNTSNTHYERNAGLASSLLEDMKA